MIQSDSAGQDQDQDQDPEPLRSVSGVPRDSHLKGDRRRSGRVSGFGAVEASVLQLAEHYQQGGRRRRLGSAGLSTARQAAGPPGGRGGFKDVGERLSSGSGPSAAAPPPFLWMSGSVQCRFGVGGPLLLLIFLFHGRRAEAAGRKEGRKKTRRGCWET